MRKIKQKMQAVQAAATESFPATSGALGKAADAVGSGVNVAASTAGRGLDYVGEKVRKTTSCPRSWAKCSSF